MKYRDPTIEPGLRFGPLDNLLRDLVTQHRRIGYATSAWRKSLYCPYPPRKIAIEPSSFCNLRCIHCAHGIGKDGKERLRRKKSLMNFDLFKKITDEASTFRYSTRFVFALMGEPLMNKRFCDMIAYAHSKGVWTQLNTNGVLLDSNRAEALIDAGLDMIYFSLDGITRETYEAIRQRGDYDRVYDNALNFMEMKFRKNAKDLVIHVGMTGEMANSQELDVFMHEMQKLPVNGIYSPLLFNWNGAIEWANPELERLHQDSIHRPICNSPFDICGVQSNGDFTACIYDHEGKFTSGNVGDSSIMDLWNNERTQIFRKAQLNGDYSAIETKGKLCSECTIMWNPMYQLKRSLLVNAMNIAKWTGKAILKFIEAPLQHQQLKQKRLWLKNNRREFIQGLAKAATQCSTKEQYETVKRKGVLFIKG